MTDSQPTSLTAALATARAARDAHGGYLVEWAEGSTWAPTLQAAEAEAAQVAKCWQATVRRVDRHGDRCEVVCTVPGAGSGDVIVVQFGGATDRKVAA